MLAFVAMSCEQIQDFIDPKGHGLVFLEGEMKAYFDDKGDTKNYKFKADLAWSAEVSADWVEVDPTSGPAGDNKIKIKVDKNKSDEKRTGYVDITLSNEKSYRIELEQLASGENLDDVTPSTSIPNNEIWYTSTDGEVVEPYSDEDGIQDNFTTFGANIISNTYENGQGIITFDGDVTTIGESAFYMCENLSSVTIPNSVTTIGDLAFRQCNSLTSVQIGDGVTTIGNLAFCECRSLISVTIPDSVTIIGGEAFSQCNSLTSVQIGAGVTTIGVWAFSLCSSLTSITIPDSVTIIERTAFRKCHSLMQFNGKFASEDGRCLIVNGVLNSFAPAGLTEYTISDIVTIIGENVFTECCSLTSVTIPDSVTTIRDDAFSWCESLTSITIPDSVTTIGESAFAECVSLSSVAIPDSVATIGDSAFSDCSSLTSVSIPDLVTIIGNNTFCGCRSLSSVTIPDSVTLIGEDAFNGCRSLTSVIIPDCVTTIGAYAFQYCDSLTSVYCKATTPPTALSYDAYGYYNWYAFDENASDRKIYVPMESVEVYKSAQGWSEYADAIVGYEFGNGEAVVPDTDPSKPANNEIWYTSTDGNIVEPCSCDYSDLDIFTSFGANIVSNAYDTEKEYWIIRFDNNLATIGHRAFSSCDNLSSVIIPDSVTTIGDWAFEDCINLTEVNIPDGVTVIEEEAFECCHSLTNITIPDGVVAIGEEAFRGCSSLTNVTIPNSVTTIDNAAFAECESLTSVTISDNLISAGYALFGACYNLIEFNGKCASGDGKCLIVDGVLNSFAPAGFSEYTIPDSVTSIGDYAFAWCSSLISITIPDSVTAIGAFTFEECINLVEFRGKFAEDNGRVLVVDGALEAVAPAGLTGDYYIPNSVTSIGDWVFWGCSSLTSVTIPDSVTTIGERAFSYCSSLTSVTIGDSVTTIGEGAFSGCHSLTSVYCKAITQPTAILDDFGYWDAFDWNASGLIIYVPTESVDAYKSATGWSEYADAIVGYDF